MPESAVYFTALSLENLRCFGPRQHVDFSDVDNVWARWTILLGENGAGKTTVLQALAAMSPVHHPNRPDDLTNGPKILVNHRHPLRVAAKLSGAAIEVAITANGEADNISFSIDSVGFYSSDGPCQSPPMFLVGYGASRVVSEKAIDFGNIDPEATLFSPGAGLQDPEQWLLQLSYASLSDNRFSSQLTSVKAALIQSLPDIDELHIRYPGYRDVMASATPKAGFIECETFYGLVPMSELSLGYQSMVSWIVDLVARMFSHYPDSKNPLAEPAVVLIDEIDLHLHPTWQRQLLSFLSEQFPATQFIATAHSPLVVQAAAAIEANLVLLKRVGNHVEVNQDLAEIHNWRIDQILTSDLFGVSSSRSPAIEALFAERTKLLNQRSRSQKEEKRLQELQADIAALPAQDSPQQQEMLDLLSNALDVLAQDS